MSILDKKHILTIDLDDSSIEYSKKIFFYNTDKNISNLYVKIKKNNDDGVGVELSANDLKDITVKLTAIKPKTNQTREIIGILTEELTDQSCAIYKFELLQEFTDQVGSVVCEFELSNASGEKVTIDAFSYRIKESKLTGLNAEIESNPDLPVLKQLIKEVKETAQTVNNIDNTNVSDIKTYSNKKIEEKFSTVSTQIKDIANKFTTEQTDNNFILKYGDKIIATIPINGTLVNYGSIVISCNEILEINEGETLDIEVYLSSKPTNNQSIVITTSNSNITTSVSELTFTPNNYATSQIITLTAIHDVSSFDDKNCLVTFASENVENITITVTIKNTDVQQSHYITDGLSLYYDFTETPTNPTTVYDKINNLSIYNSGYTSDSYTDNGVYLVNGGGANAFKMGSSSVSYSAYQTMPEFDDFLNKLKEGNGLTVEYFGQYIPTYVLYAYNTGLELSGTGSVSGGYLANFVSTGSATLMYLNTSDESTNIKLNQVNSVTKDGSTITAFSADNKADTYIHLVITGDESGTLTWYLNGNPMTNTTTASDFKAWDYDTMFKSSYIMVNRAGTEDTNRLIYPATSIKIYNRALSQEEIQTNLEYEVSRTNFIESASVTP